MADVTAMLVGELEVINDDHIELDLIDEYAYPIADRNLVINQRIRLGPTPFVGITNYVQVTVWRYSNDAFKRHFRMSRDAYVRLLHRFTHYLPFSTVSHNVNFYYFFVPLATKNHSEQSEIDSECCQVTPISFFLPPAK
ncbi:uncharacterized protein LOC124311883 [Daphnia pulicaria]|uniref:uncharacterized protein LOC124311883 n=1 Tax=Daphnia pulicaria TaxID=35523 RepID=UPI001EEAEA69|nr:uncharacterized protein LOC124311883 [Daphnia pulicaria]